jgi:hypothetical protein
VTLWLTDPLWWAQQQPQLDVSVVIAPDVGASTTIAPRAAAATMFRRCPSTKHHLEGNFIIIPMWLWLQRGSEPTTGRPGKVTQGSH